VGLWKAGSEDRVLGDITVHAQQWPADLDLRLLVVTIVGLLLLWFSQRVFSRLQGNFAQEI
jgi:ABC-2 type transport system permease protein